MFQRVLVAAALFGGKLSGAFVQLRGHLRGFFSGTTERDKDLGELGNFHVENLIRKQKRRKRKISGFLRTFIAPIT